MNNKAIGVFDSGLGGLTAVREIRKIMPNENIIYFGDTGRMPYGARSREQIRLFARQDLAFLDSFGVKAILAACGTVSSNSGDILEANSTKALGVLTPGVKELSQLGLKKLGVIATATSIKSGSFEAQLRNLCPVAEIHALACPEFVPMIEAGHSDRSDELVKDVVSRTLQPLKDAGIEALLLGCTHYGIIAEAIEDFMPNVALVGAADAAARALKVYLDENDMRSDTFSFERYYTSGSREAFEELAPKLLGHELKGEVEEVSPAAEEE